MEDIYVVTYSGRRVSLTDPDASQIDIRDIAHHLALNNRFAGATQMPYSVAQHSKLVSDILVRMGIHSPRLQLLGLLHDAHEFTGDIITPKKRALFGSRLTVPTLLDDIECRLDIAIFDYAGLGDVAQIEMDTISIADRVAFATEWRDLMPADQPCPETLVRPEKYVVKPWPWPRAEEEFLATFARLQTAANLKPRRVTTGIMK